jgi:threonine synthase
LTNSNHALVKEWYANLEGKSKRMELPQEWHARLQTDFRSARIADEDLCSTLVRIHDAYQYWADPHTGVALCAAEQLGYLQISSKRNEWSYSKPQTPVVVMATASPCKFQEAMTIALGKDKWDEYFNSAEFPGAARETLRRPEKEPVLYPALEGNNLEQNQVEWEQLARDLIERL